MGTQSVGNYELIKKLATGGMAEVWLANQTGIQGFNRHIVVKRILPHLSEDPEFVQMFLNEAKIASRFNHPNIAQIYDLGQGDGQYFIAMEFIHGEDLGRLMRKAWSTGQWIARPLAIRIIAEACKGLFYAHTRKDERGQELRVVHRDISPQNILISFDGSVKLVDFGIAKAADQASMTKSGAIKGKFAYMAPEQAGGKPLDARTDLFALGLVLYELLTGVRPLKRDSELATLQAALECAIDPPSVVAEVPAELDDVVMRALAKAPDDRYRDASMFQMALEEFLISQRLVATSVQIAELMETLFAERRAEEAKLGAPNPASQGESQQGLPAMPEMPLPRSPSLSQPRRSRSGSNNPDFTGTNPAGPGEAGGTVDGRGGPPQGEVAEWEAPPAQQAPVGPSRRYSNSPGSTAMQRAHSPNGPDMTRAKPATREFEEQPEPRPSQPSGRKSRVGIRPAALNGVNGSAHAREEEAQQPPAQARRSSSSQKLLKKSTDEMPEAPPRRSRELGTIDEEPYDPEQAPAPATSSGKKKKKGEKNKSSDLERADVDFETLKKKQAQRRGIVVVGLLIVSLAALALIFKSGIVKQVGSGGVPILLTVSSNPQTRVIVKKGGGMSNLVDLGSTPLEEVKGAEVGDTIMLMNEQQCLNYEESIQFGQINEVRKIEKNFTQAQLEVTTKPPMKGLSIFCNGQRIGTTGMNITVFEGPHRFELRDDRLQTAVPFDITVLMKGKGYVNKPSPVDVADAIRK